MLTYVSFPSEYTSKSIIQALNKVLPESQIVTDKTKLGQLRTDETQQQKLIQSVSVDRLCPSARP